MSNGKQVDMLSEDPEISGQKFALISIVGPHLPQKCDIWGLKIRGVAESVDEAKQMTKRLMKFDNMYDIYTVSVGKFFPLTIEPYDVKEVEYSDEKLNDLMKSYLKNREDANQHYHQRKQDMMEKAIKEGTKEGQSQLSNKVEHPIAVLQRKQEFEEKAKELREQLESIEKDLGLTSEKYANYTENQRLEAEDEVKKATSHLQQNNLQESKNELKHIKDEIASELKEEEKNVELKSVLDQLNNIEDEIKKVHKSLDGINKEDSPNDFERLSSKLNVLELRREDLKVKLSDKQLVNEYINKEFKGDSSHDSLFS